MAQEIRKEIEIFLEEQSRRQQQLTEQKEAIRLELIEEAKLAVGQYQAEWEQLKPAAQKRLNDVIKPWWRDFTESGLEDKLTDWRRNNIGWLGLSDTIVYPWPRRIIRELAEQKPFEWTATHILQTPGVQPSFVRQEELWKANFFIGKDGFRISRWPLDGGGFAFALGASSLEIPLYLSEADQLVDKVYPKILSEFALQIESGRVWEILKKSLEPKPVKVISREEVSLEAQRLRDQYYRKK